jgi:hypothetical protein
MQKQTSHSQINGETTNTSRHDPVVSSPGLLSPASSIYETAPTTPSVYSAQMGSQIPSSMPLVRSEHQIIYTLASSCRTCVDCYLNYGNPHGCGTLSKNPDRELTAVEKFARALWEDMPGLGGSTCPASLLPLLGKLLLWTVVLLPVFGTSGKGTESLRRVDPRPRSRLNLLSTWKLLWSGPFFQDEDGEEKLRRS